MVEELSDERLERIGAGVDPSAVAGLVEAAREAVHFVGAFRTDTRTMTADPEEMPIAHHASELSCALRSALAAIWQDQSC